MEDFEEDYSRALNQLSPLIGDGCVRSTGLHLRATDPKVVAVWLAHRLRGHLQAFAVLLNAQLIRDAEGVERAALEAAICLEGLRAAPEDFMKDLRKDASSTLRGQISIWRELDAGLAADAEKHRASLSGAEKPARLSLHDLADGAANPMLYTRYKHLSANSVHVTGLSLTSDGADIFGLEKIAPIRRRDTIAWMTHAAFSGGIAFAAIMSFDDLRDAMSDVMLGLESRL